MGRIFVRCSWAWKTYMGTMLCEELGGKTLVLAPPHLIDETMKVVKMLLKILDFAQKDYGWNQSEC